MKDQYNHKYDDIINLPHPTSKKHPRMSLYARAAQFSPFAALTGHEAAIKETVRQTDAKQVLSEEVIEELNKKLYLIAETIGIFGPRLLTCNPAVQLAPSIRAIAFL